MAITFTKYCLIQIALTALCLAYISFTLHVNENKRILSVNVSPKSEDKAVIEPKIKNVSGFIVLAIFKNEAMVFKEWISHYLWQGASHFYLIDDGSTDDYLATIDKQVLKRITIIKNDEKHAQTHAYNSLLPMLQERHSQDWVLVVDLDEFLYDRPPQTIASYLSTVSDDIGQVSFPWYTFGSSGHISQPFSVRCSFVQRSHSPMTQQKSAVRVKAFDKICVHGHALLPGYRKHEELDKLQMNHYRIQSREFFGKVKMIRGDVAGLPHRRTWGYFEEIDARRSRYVDNELCSILGCCARFYNNFVRIFEEKLRA